MSGSIHHSKIIHVRVEHDETGLWTATSESMASLYASASSIERLNLAIKAKIKTLFAACGQEVIVSSVDDGDGVGVHPFVAFSAAVAAKELAEISA